MTRCPKCCKADVQQQISIEGLIFKKKKVVTFCPLCDYRNEHIFNLSKQDVEIENIIRLNPDKNTTITYNTKREIIK